MIKLKPILEATARELVDLNIRENKFEPYKIRYIGFSFRNKIVYFKVGKYIQKIQIPGLSVISKMKGTLEEKIKIAVEDDIKVYCDCHDWLYGGFMFIGTQLGYSLHKENRPPDIRNPKQDGTVCKHLNFLLVHINKFIPRIIEDYKTTSKTRTTIIHDKRYITQIKQIGLKQNKKK